MSELKPDIDLETLARPATEIKQPRRFKVIYLVPLTILVIFLLVLSGSIRELLLEKTEVTVVRPSVVTGVVAPAGTVVLQAAGWVEPEPFPVSVTSLTGGVVEDVLIKESDRVEKGQIVARIISTLKEHRTEELRGRLKRAEAELQLAKVELANAQESFDAPIALQEAVAKSKATVIGHEHECRRNEAALKEQEAAVAVARADYETQKFLEKEGAAGPWQVELAEAKRIQEEAKLAKFESELSRSRALRKVADAALKRAEEDFRLRLKDRLRVESAKASVLLKEAAVQEAAAVLAEAEQHVTWCDVKAPVSGIVLARLAMPGSAVNEEKHGAPVCTLYDPKELRLRVDVPQTDLAKVSIGQHVRITTSAKKAQYEGEVIRILDEADIQKVTIQIHVKFKKPDELIKPEMLCQARFEAPEQVDQPTPTAEKRRAVTIPKRLLVKGNSVWVIDARGRSAELRRVTVGADLGDRVEVTDGINQSDKLIDQGRQSLEDGQAIVIVEGK